MPEGVRTWMPRVRARMLIGMRMRSGSGGDAHREPYRRKGRDAYRDAYRMCEGCQ